MTAIRWKHPKPSDPSAGYYVTCGRFTMSKARVNGGWVYTLADGDELVCSGTKEACKLEAERREQDFNKAAA